MDGDRKAKSFSLETSELETALSARRGSSSLASSVTDIRELEDDDYRALLDVAVQASYKRTLSTSSSDTGQVVASEPVMSDYALPSTGLSKDAQNIYSVLKEAADRDAYREDEVVEIRFDQKKLGKSASHESCQQKPTRPSHGRHSVYSMNSSMDVDTVFSTCLFGATNAAVDAAGGVRHDNSCSVVTSPSAAGAVCGCHSPGAPSGRRDGQEPRQLNRSFSSAGGGNWTSSIGDKGDFFCGAARVSDSNSVDPFLDEDSPDMHHLVAKALNGKSGRATDAKKGSQCRDDGTKTGSTDNNDLAGNNDTSGESLELDVIKQRFNTAFLSNAAVTSQVNGKKRRSSSQRGHNTHRQGDYQLSPQKPLGDDSDRMTRSELGPISGIKSPPRTSRLFRRKRLQQDERGVILSEQMNGFRGTDDLDDILLYIEGPDAVRKTACDQQTKKTKKKAASESGGNMNNGNVQANGGAKKEKIRRSTEGDDGTSVFDTAKSGNDAATGTLNYKHRSTDSLGALCEDEDRRSLAACGKSTSSDASIGAVRPTQENSAVSGSSKVANVESAMDSVSTGDALGAKQWQMEELKETVEGSAGENATTTGADDEQFIPVTNKKQKKTKTEFRNTAMRTGRSGKYREASDAGKTAKRSVTPPAREAASSGGRRRRNSLDYSRVSDDVHSEDLNTPFADAAWAAASARGPIFVKPDSAEAANAANDDSADKPSYANVAAAHRRIHSPPMLGDFITGESINKQKFQKKRGANYPGSRVGRVTRDDGERSDQTPRQSSSLNASRSTSPAGIPTAVTTNLANASSPDLKSFTGESLSSLGGGQQFKMTYATIAADKRQHPTYKPPAANSTSLPVAMENKVRTAKPDDVQPNEGVNQPQNSDEMRQGNTERELSANYEPVASGDCPAASEESGTKKGVTDTAVNTDPFSPSAMAIPATNLGENAFTFEQKPSTSETRSVLRTGDDRSSCSGVFKSPRGFDIRNPSSRESTDFKPNSNSINGNNRERRNSCPVQFLDRAGASFRNPLNVSGLNFVYGDADDDEEFCAALARSATISSASTGPIFETAIAAQAHDSLGSKDDVVSDERIQSAMADASQKIPNKILRTMANYVSNAWTEFTRDPNSMVYYHTDSTRTFHIRHCTNQAAE